MSFFNHSGEMPPNLQEILNDPSRVFYLSELQLPMSPDPPSPIDFEAVKGEYLRLNVQQRLQYCWQKAQSNELTLNFGQLVSDAKSTNLAEKSKNVGNRHFGQEKHEEALKAYNEALAWAPPGSAIEAICYANRSAVYFNMVMFRHCLENIKMALDSAAYPESLRSKLLARRAECEKLLAVGIVSWECKTALEEPSGWRNLSYPPNPKAPFMVDRLKFKYERDWGLTVVATQPLMPGDQLILEPTHVHVLDAPSSYIACSNCWEINNLNLLPCGECHNVMFCSVLCMQQAREAYHKHECPLIREFAHFKDANLHLHTRIFLTMAELFTVEELTDILEAIHASPVRFVADLDFSEHPLKTALMALLVSHPLKTLRTHRQIFDATIEAAAFVHQVLTQCPLLGRKFENDLAALTAIQLMLRIFLKPTPGQSTNPTRTKIAGKAFTLLFNTQPFDVGLERYNSVSVRGDSTGAKLRVHYATRVIPKGAQLVRGNVLLDLGSVLDACVSANWKRTRGADQWLCDGSCANWQLVRKQGAKLPKRELGLAAIVGTVERAVLEKREPTELIEWLKANDENRTCQSTYLGDVYLMIAKLYSTRLLGWYLDPKNQLDMDKI